MPWKRRGLAWLRLLSSGGLMLGTISSGCLADALRDISDELDDLANEVDDDRDDFDEFLDDLEDIFD